MIRLEALQTEPAAFGKSVEEHRATPVEVIAERFRGTGEHNFTLGAFENDTLIGTATFVRDAEIGIRHKGHIYGVYVTDAHRGKRYRTRADRCTARTCAARPVARASAAGCSHRPEHAARRMYRSCGFETYGTEPDALKIGGTYIDEDHMILRVRPRETSR